MTDTQQQRQDAILGDLALAQCQVKASHEFYLVATAQRNRLLKDALAAGVKQADLARLTGLTRARIAQLR